MYGCFDVIVNVSLSLLTTDFLYYLVLLLIIGFAFYVFTLLIN